MRVTPVVLVLVTLMGTACGDGDVSRNLIGLSSPIARSTRAESVQITGRWIGVFDGASLELLLREESDGEIEGSGNLRIVDDDGVVLSIAVRAKGDLVFPNVSILLESSGFPDINLTGVVFTERILDLRAHGGGFDNTRVRLTRFDDLLEI